MPVCRPPAVGRCVSSRSRATRTTAAGRALGDEIPDYLVTIAAKFENTTLVRYPSLRLVESRLSESMESSMNPSPPLASDRQSQRSGR